MVGFEQPSQETLKPHEDFTALKEKTGLGITYNEEEKSKIITVSLNRELEPGEGCDVSCKSLSVEFSFPEKLKAATFYKQACEELKEYADSREVATKMSEYFEIKAAQNYPLNPENGKQFTREEVEKIRRYLRSLADNMSNLDMLVIGMKNTVNNLADLKTADRAMENLKGTPYENYSREEAVKLFRFIINLAAEEAAKLKGIGE